MRFIRAGSFLLAAMTALVGGALADDGPKIGVGNAPSTHIRVLGATLPHGAAGDYACVVFVNNAQAAATFARFKLFAMSTEKKDLGMQVVEARATVAPGARNVPQTADASTDPAALPNCKLLPFSKATIGFMIVMLDRFEFADGTSWSLPDKNASPSPSPTP